MDFFFRYQVRMQVSMAIVCALNISREHSSMR